MPDRIILVNFNTIIMLTHQDLQKCLFLDIETVSQFQTMEEMPLRFQDLWAKKSQTIQGNTAPVQKPASEMYADRAGIYAEFGKIICISCGFLIQKDGQWVFRVKSFSGTDEAVLLRDFGSMLQRSAFTRLCAHNGKEFDFPYLCRRMLILGLDIPPQLDLQGKKPWETGHLDTMELWKFGDYKSYTSLDLLSAVMGIPSPKDDISGAEVGRVFWQENGLDRIRIYCEKDVLTTCQILLRMNRLPLLNEAQIEIV